MDLLLEVEKLEWLMKHVDDKNYGRTCLYLASLPAYLPESDDATVLKTAYQIYSAQDKHTDAMRIALRLGDQVCLPVLPAYGQHAGLCYGLWHRQGR